MSSPTSPFLSNVVKLVSGNAAAQAIAIIIMPLLTRLFSPGAFGVAALFIAISGVIHIASCMRYELAIVLPEDEGEAANLFFVSIVSVVVMVIVIMLIIFFGQGMIVRIFNMPELGMYLWLLPVSVLSNGFILAFTYWVSRVKSFGSLSRATVLSSAAAQSSKLGGGLLGYTSGGILIGATVLGQSLSALYLGWRIFKKDFRAFIRNVRLNRMRQCMVRYGKFPLIDLWGALLNTVSWQLPSLMLAAFFSPAIVGLYALGNSVIRMPMNLMGSSIAHVFYQKASEAKIRGNIDSVVERIFSRLVAFGLFPMLVLSLTGEDLFIVVFGESWAEAGVYTQILAPWMFFTFISSPLSMLFSVFERQGSALFIQISIFLTRIVSLTIGGLMGNVYVAIGLFSFSGVLVYGTLCLWNLRLSRVPFAVFMDSITRHALIFLPAGIVILFIQHVLKVSHLITLAVAFSMVLIYELYTFANDEELRMYVHLPTLWERENK